MKVLLVILIASPAISLAKSTDPAANFDITTILNNSISSIFEKPDPDTIEESIENTYKGRATPKFDFIPFTNEFYFTEVKFIVWGVGSVHVQYEFFDHKTTIFIRQLNIRIDANLDATDATIHAPFTSYVTFENISITAIKRLHQLPELKLHVHTKREETVLVSSKNWPNLTKEVREELDVKQKINEISPSLLFHYFQRKEDFLQSLDATFCNHPKTEIASRYPDFENSAEKYRYFIPSVTSLRRTLSNITIAGLWNFHSHSIGDNLDRFENTLRIGNIRGHANLYYGPESSTIFPLRFEAGSISISVDKKKKSVSVTAYNYSVLLVNSNSSLTEHQRKWVMEGIEAAIASSIMPTIRGHQKMKESEHPVVKISTKMSQQFHGRTIQKLYQDWDISKRENITIESNLQFESSDFNISIFCAPIQHRDPWPHWIHCNLYDYLQISFGRSRYRYFSGKIRLSNSTHKFNAISFAMSDVVGLIKRNNSKGNDAFELRAPSHEITVKLSSKSKNNFTKKQLDAILRKTKEMLTSSNLELRLLYAKPLLNFALDYCTTPVKLFDDFLPFVPDNELAYYVPDGNDRSNETSQISDIVIVPETWTKTPEVWASFYNYRERNLVSFVNSELSDSEIRMSFTNATVQFDELVLLCYDSVLRNNTESGEMEAQIYFHKSRIHSRYNLSISAIDPELLEERLQYIIANSLQKSSKDSR